VNCTQKKFIDAFNNQVKKKSWVKKGGHCGDTVVLV
jgi:hypothetical protein